MIDKKLVSYSMWKLKWYVSLFCFKFFITQIMICMYVFVIWLLTKIKTRKK